MALFFLCFLAFAAYAQTNTNLEEYFNLCLEFGAPLEVVQLFQSFRTYKGENNGSISYVVREDNSLLRDKPYSEYQIWYTIDKEQGLYQSSLIVRGDRPVLQNILTGYLQKFNRDFGEPVYTNLENGSLLVFWYNETTFTVKARLILDVVNSYKFVSITYCSPLMKHTNLLKTLYNGTAEDEPEIEIGEMPPSSRAADVPDAAAEEPPAGDAAGAAAGDDENTAAEEPDTADDPAPQEETDAGSDSD